MILLAHMVILFLMFPGTAKPFTITAVSFYNHVNGAQRFQFLHTLVICYFMYFVCLLIAAILMDVRIFFYIFFHCCLPRA